MNIEICKYKNNAKSMFSFVFDDGCYRESNELVYEKFKSIYESTGIKFKATSAQTVNFLHDYLIERWKELIDEGYFDICAHSMSHCITFNSATDPAILREDAMESQRRLEEIYGVKCPIYVTPGGGSDPIGCSVLKDYYIANRNCKVGINYPGSINWYNICNFTAKLAREDSEYTDMIKETVESGGWSVQINHWITKKTEDVFHSQSYESFLKECDYLAEHSLKNDILVISFNDAVIYLQTAERSDLVFENSILEIKNNLDKEIYNQPLTVKITTDSPIKINGKGYENKTLHPENSEILVDIHPNEKYEIQ